MRQLLPLAAVGLLAAAGCSRQAAPEVTSPSAASDTTPRGTVTVEIVRDGETETLQVPGVADGTSLESVMRSITEVSVSIRGSGSTAFVDSIGGVATGADTGWTFQVDGEFANQGIGNTTLHPPTTVRWKFGGWE